MMVRSPVAMVLVALATLVVLGCASSVGWSNYGPELGELTGAQWADDLDHLVEELERRHPKPYHSVERERFVAFVDDLKREAAEGVPGLDLASRMVAGISRALALLQEGHTTLNSSVALSYPVLLRTFPTADGGPELRVAYADEAFASLGGARVVAVGAYPAEAALAIAASAAAAELPDARQFFAVRLMSNPIIMQGLGLAGPEGLRLVVETDAGPEEVLVPVVQETDLRMSPASAPDTRPSISLMRNERFWYEIVEGTLYFRYNSSTTDAEPMMNDIISLLDSGEASRLILDLRFNGGGNSGPGTRFVRALADRDVGRERGRFFVVVGPGTFSSAIMTAVDAMDMTEAIFVGTPIATPVNAWGEVLRFALPNSGLAVGHSTRFWDNAAGKDLRLVNGTIVPDPGWEAPWTFADWYRDFDPAVELILERLRDGGL